MIDREGLIKRISAYLIEEMSEYGVADGVYVVLSKAFLDAITKPSRELNEFWLGHISAEIYSITTDARGLGDDAYCHQLEQELSQPLGIEH